MGKIHDTSNIKIQFKQKLREFSITKTALQHILKELL